MRNRNNILELENLLFRHEMYKNIFKSEFEKKYIIAGCSQLIDIFENNIDIISHNKEIRNLFITKMNEFIKEYTVPKKLINKINMLIHKIKA